MDLYNIAINWVISTVSSIIEVYRCSQSNTFHVCYENHDALAIAWAFTAFIALYCLIASTITGNCSKVDQLWSLTPVLFSWHFAFHEYLVSHVVNERSIFVAILITIWGVRLSFNFWRKGGYGNLISHEEDYRWPILRAKMNILQFFLFNVTFISSYQNILLLLITTPVALIAKGPSKLQETDIILIALFLVLLCIESIADEQHWRFQQSKHKLSPAEQYHHSDLQIRQGFFESGLFYFSRHPNYFAEQSMWVVIYLFTVTQDSYLNWSIAGCIQLILLFQGSMIFSESITKTKYPLYRYYQQTTSRCIPNFRDETRLAYEMEKNE